MSKRFFELRQRQGIAVQQTISDKPPPTHYQADAKHCDDVTTRTLPGQCALLPKQDVCQAYDGKKHQARSLREQSCSQH